MIRDTDRAIARLLVRLGIWRVEIGMFRTVQIRTRRGTRWLYDWMKRRQTPEDRPYHHAPACPASRCRCGGNPAALFVAMITRPRAQALVFQRCNCGAVKHGIVSHGR